MFTRDDMHWHPDPWRSSGQGSRREALNDGMLTLREYGIKKIAFGETSFDEVMAVTDDRSVY